MNGDYGVQGCIGRAYAYESPTAFATLDEVRETSSRRGSQPMTATRMPVMIVLLVMPLLTWSACSPPEPTPEGYARVASCGEEVRICRQQCDQEHGYAFEKYGYGPGGDKNRQCRSDCEEQNRNCGGPCHELLDACKDKCIAKLLEGGDGNRCFERCESKWLYTAEEYCTKRL